MKKRLLAWVLSFALALSLLPVGVLAAEPHPFQDVPSDHWANEAVQYVYEEGLMDGVGPTTFAPGGTLTRAMFVTILGRQDGVAEDSQGENPFTDVADGQWYTPYVTWAAQEDIVGGYGDNRFGPTDPITREQMAAILYRYAQYKGYDTSETGSLDTFPDAGEVSEYAVEPMAWTVGTGLIAGMEDNTLRPQGTATRAQAATLLMRFCETVVGEPQPTPTTYTVTFDWNYDNKGTYTTATVEEGQTVQAPANPTRSGYTFAGWYTQATGGEKFDFDSAVTGDVTVYAHWRKSYPITYYYTVTFEVGASDVNNIPETQQVRSGNVAIEPPEPTRAGYLFGGWYTDNAFSNAYDFSDPVTGNLTLYAKWNPKGNVPDPGENTSYRVTFDLNTGSPGIYEVQILNVGEKAVKPSSDPERTLYRFTGWYIEPETVTQYDFNNEVTGDITLYAGWGSLDGTEGLYSASDTIETTYSISGVEMTSDETTVSVTLNTNSACALIVEFFDDTIGTQDWSKEELNNALNQDPIETVATITPEYGELITVSVPVETLLPDYYIIRAKLVGLDIGTGQTNELCEPYVCINYTEQYSLFDALTVDAFAESSVVNFDDDPTTNFGVLKDSVKQIVSGETQNHLTVQDVDVDGEIVPASKYTFANPDESVQQLTSGDAIYIVDTQYLFKIAEVIENNDGSISLIPSEDAFLTDFYDVIKVDMQAVEDDGIQTYAEIIDVDSTLKKEIGGNFSFTPGGEDGKLKISGELTGSVSLNIKMTYNFHLFGEDYFNCSIRATNEIKTNLTGEVTFASNENAVNSEAEEARTEFELIKVSIPTPVVGLSVYVQPTVPVEWSVTGNVSAVYTSKQTAGFIWDTYSGNQSINDKSSTLSLQAEGSATIKGGPKLAIGVQFANGVVRAQVSAEAGLKLTATAEVGSDDVTNSAPEKHACGLCVSGSADWFFDAKVTLSYRIVEDILEADLVDWTILQVEGPIGKLYFSVINSPDSVFGGNAKFGFGDCINKSYRTELQVVNDENVSLDGLSVTVAKQGLASIAEGTSTYVTYLYNGIYNAGTAIDGVAVNKSFVVKDSAQTIILSPASSNGTLSGKIVDSMNEGLNINGADIKISQNGLVIASAKSNSEGIFNVSLPDGTFLVEITKDGYIPFSTYEKIENAETTYIQTVEMIPGSGFGGFRGIITDALTNDPISDVSLQLRSGWGNSNYGSVLATLTTNADGAFQFNTVNLFGTILGLSCGNYTLTASKDGYISTSFNIVVYPGETNESPQQNATMTPALTQDDSYRIVLTWGENPRDLDSHVFGHLSNTDTFHVYYGHKSHVDGELEVCNLDRDDTTSYGPETITLNINTSSPYYYYVHRYSGSGTVTTSNAQVKVYHGSDLVRTFNVPTGFGDGDIWNVFAIVDGQIKVQNTITDSADLNYAGPSGIAPLSLDILEKKA